MLRGEYKVSKIVQFSSIYRKLLAVKDLVLSSIRHCICGYFRPWKDTSNGREITDNVDRISDLPEFIIHKILKSLGTKDAVRTSLLSKRWWEFYTYSPDFEFYHEKFAKKSFLNKPMQKRLREDRLKKILEARIGIKNMIDVRLQRLFDQKLPLKQFSLSMAFNDDLPSWLDAWIEVAVSCRVETLHIHVVKELRKDTYSYSLSQVIFASKSLKCLSLRECCLECPNTIANIGFRASLRELALWHVDIDQKTIDGLISNCPLIESLKLKNCVGFKRLRVSGLHLLKHLVYYTKEKVEECIIEDSPTLEKLEYSYHLKTTKQRKSLRNISFGSSLRKLALYWVDIDEKTISSLLSNCPLIESLKLKNCVGFKRLRVCGMRKLRELVVFCDTNECIIIEDNPLLEKLECYDPPVLHCTCKNLKTLAFHDVKIDEEHLSNILSRSIRIECLSLLGCNLPQALAISSPCLRKIDMHRCHNLVEAKINTPSLSSFKYYGETLPILSPVSRSGKWDAKILTPTSPEVIDAAWFQRLNQCISNKFHVLEIAIWNREVVFGLEDLKDASSFPCPCEEVNIDLCIIPRSSFATFVDGLLCSIHPIILKFNLPLHIADGFLKEWEQQVKDRREASCCSGNSYKIRCWRHYLKDVKTSVSVKDVEDVYWKPHNVDKLVVLEFDW